MFKLDQIAGGFITLTVSPETAYLLALGCEVAHKSVLESGFVSVENGFDIDAKDETAISLMAFSSTFQAAAFAATFTRPLAAPSLMRYQDEQNAHLSGKHNPTE